MSAESDQPVRNSGKRRYWEKKGNGNQSSASAPNKNANNDKKEMQDLMNQYDNEVDEIFGFERITPGTERLGWLLNYVPTTTLDTDGNEISGVDLYFIDRDGQNFKGSVVFEPYFLVDISDKNRLNELAQHFQKRISTCFVTIIDKEDLDMPNHLNGNKNSFLKLTFRKVADLVEAKSMLR